MNGSIKIFLVEPKDKSNYKNFIVYSDSEEEARSAASSKLNPAKKKQPNTSTPQIDETYINENLSKCYEINVTILNSFNQTVKITYLNNEYSLTKDHAKPLSNS